MADWVTTSVAMWSGVGFDVSGAKKQKGGGSRRWSVVVVVVAAGRGTPSPKPVRGTEPWGACLVGCIGSFQKKVVGVAAKRLQP